MIARVGANAAAAQTVAMPAHQAGDLLLFWAYRDGNVTPPTKPSPSASIPVWNDIDGAGSGGNNNASRLAYAITTGSNHTSGTWGTATSVIVLVYRGPNVADAIGGDAAAGANGEEIRFPALTMQSPGRGTSWIAAFVGHREATNVDRAPDGMALVASTPEAAAFDTVGGVTSWAEQVVTVNASSGWRARTVELRAAAPEAMWPSTLPGPLTEGFQETAPDVLLRSQVDAGPPKVRRRFTAGVRPFSMTIRGSKAQIQILDDFFVVGCLSGARRFEWVHPRTKAAASFRFASPPSYGPAHGEPDVWDAHLALEVAP